MRQQARRRTIRYRKDNRARRTRAYVTRPYLVMGDTQRLKKPGHLSANARERKKRRKINALLRQVREQARRQDFD
ncbi:hypothetical protein [Salinisphaera sp. LB1]|uniref:hypothetical protein n=1 Tax=Salinisphaera sp. LB1 TaxID=2183911 RepID=UPI001C9E8D69|nr:hypothetical protein [Salinisphaera sp. LB1]